MATRTAYFLTLALIIAALVSAIYAYPLLPDRIVSHWNFAGEPDGHMGKFWGVSLIPLILLFLSALFAVLPRIDPFRKNVSDFRREYNLVITAILLFLGYTHALLLVWNLGFQFNIGQFIAPAIGVLFIIIGLVLPMTKRNWFLGIRTPWTLSSDTVWSETHKIGGKLFLAVGIITILGSFLFSAYLFLVMIALVVVSVIWSFVYSYLRYRREQKVS